MSSRYGKNVELSIFGQSHGEAIGVIMDGIPPGHKIDMDELARFLKRRAPGGNSYSTKRSEADSPEFLSGLVDNTTCGAPLTAIIRNNDTHSSDYEKLKDIPRPGHADYTAQIKYKGFQDVRGGGHFSGRLTAPLCIAGGIIIQILSKEGIHVAAHIASIGKFQDTPFDALFPEKSFARLKEASFPVISEDRGKEMINAIESAKADGDSLGGVIECAATGVPAGLGEPMFDGMENRLSAVLFGIPAVKGIEFGAGFGAAEMCGSDHNDIFYIDSGTIKTRTNNHGGILGGITSGMPLVFRVAVKPTPSISREQSSVNLSKMKDEMLTVTGRHDPCIVPRAVPCVEAAAAIAIYDAFLAQRRDYNLLNKI